MYVFDRLGPVAPAIAAHVGRHRMEPGRGERRELMAPGIPRFRKAVAQKDERPGAGFGDVDADAVRLDRAVRHFGRHADPQLPGRDDAAGRAAAQD